MNHSIKIGVSFGLTSGIITTLGLMVGLAFGTGSRAVVIGGILTIAVADAFSDSLGIHMSEESEGEHTHKEVWQSTIATFISKLIFATTFLIPVLTLELNTAIIVSIIWGLSALSVLSYYVAKNEGENPSKVVGEHLMIAVLVVIATFLVGEWISATFPS